MLQVLATVLAEPPSGTALASWRDAKSAGGGRAAAADPGGHGARPVRGLPPGGRRRPEIDHGDLRRGPAHRRYVALGRGADLDPGRQDHVRSPPPRSTSVQAAPHDVFGIDPFAVRDSLRFRIWPETAVGLTLAGKKPGAGMEPQLEDLAFAQQPGSDMRPYDPAHRGGAGRRPCALRPEGRDRGRVAGCRPDPRRRHPVHPYARGAGDPKKPTGCCPNGRPGTTRQAEPHAEIKDDRDRGRAMNDQITSAVW